MPGLWVKRYAKQGMPFFLHKKPGGIRFPALCMGGEISHGNGESVRSISKPAKNAA